MISCSSSDQYAYACSMPSGWRSGRQSRSKSASVPGLIRRVVIQTKFSSIAPSSRPARVAAADPAGGNPGMSHRLFLVPGQQGRGGSGRGRHAAKRGSRDSYPAWWTNDAAIAERAVAAEEAPGNGPRTGRAPRSGGAARPGPAPAANPAAPTRRTPGSGAGPHRPAGTRTAGDGPDTGPAPARHPRRDPDRALPPRPVPRQNSRQGAELAFRAR